MPIYEYKCEDCGVESEEMLHWSERDVPINTPCTCGGKVHLKMSLSSFQLKGGGWYSDGYGTPPPAGEVGPPPPPPTVSEANAIMDAAKAKAEKK